MGQYVGIDLHRRSTTIVRMAQDGEVLGTERFVSQAFELAQAMAAAGPEPEVVLESTYGWYWAAGLLQDLGAHVHLAHALGNNWGNRRVKNDERDAQDLAAMLALGRLAEVWIAPPEARELHDGDTTPSVDIYRYWNMILLWPGLRRRPMLSTPSLKPAAETSLTPLALERPQSATL